MLSESKKYNVYKQKRQKTPHISHILSHVTRKTMKNRGFHDNTLIKYWSAIVGPQLAMLSRPMRLRRKSKEEKILVVKVEGVMAVEIQHLEPQIIERINHYYGTLVVHKLRIVQGVVYTFAPSSDVFFLTEQEVTDLAETYDDIQYSRLRKALARLAIRMKHVSL